MPVYELEESNWTPIPEDSILKAEIVKIEETTKNFGEGDVPRVEFAFLVREPGNEYDGRRLWGDTPRTFSTDSRCKLRIWAQEIMGQQLPEGFKLNTDDLVGLECRIAVGMKTYTNKQGEAVSKNFVTDVLRTKADGESYEEPF